MTNSSTRGQTVGIAGAQVSGLEPVTRYDRVSIVLHWVTAALVVPLWGIAQIIDDFAKGPPRIAARSVHILLGVVLLAVLLTRVFWRMSSGRKLPMAGSGIMGYSGRVVHYALYLLLAAVLVLGVTNVWVRGDTITGLFTVPELAPGDKALKETVESLHKTLANAILILAGLHALAALVQHYVLRNDVLRRMLSGGKTP